MLSKLAMLVLMCRSLATQIRGYEHFDKDAGTAYYVAMRIGLLSDTHIPEVQKALPVELRKVFAGVDLILHAGDIYAASVLEDLACIAPVLAAEGDDDFGDTLLDTRVKKKHVLNLGGKTVWLIHERPSIASLQSKDIQERVNGHKPDIVVFGHAHLTIVQRSDDVLFVNPGSPTFLMYRRGLGTVGILNIDESQVDVNIVKLEQQA